MPIDPTAYLSSCQGTSNQNESEPYNAENTAENQRQHQEHWSGPGYVSGERYAMVHKPIPIRKAMQMPKAKAALDAEWKKLADIPAWDVSTVREKSDATAEAKRLGKKGTLRITYGLV